MDSRTRTLLFLRNWGPGYGGLRTASLARYVFGRFTTIPAKKTKYNLPMAALLTRLMKEGLVDYYYPRPNDDYYPRHWILTKKGKEVAETLSKVEESIPCP